jgi:hypothetical protein
MLLEEFGFHPLALDDVAKGRNGQGGRVRIFVRGDVPWRRSDQRHQEVEVDLFAGRNYLVTVHRPALRWKRPWVAGRAGGPCCRASAFSIPMDALIDTCFGHRRHERD